MKNMKKTEEEKLTYGIVGVVLGVLSLLMFVMPYFGLFVAVAGVIFGSLTKVGGLKVTSIILGVLGIGINAIMLVLAIVFIVAFGG